MNLVFATEARFYRGADGLYYADSASFSMALWQRYLAAFDKVYILARVTNQSNNSFVNVIDDRRISFIPIPYYIGLGAFFKKRREILQVLKVNALPGRVYICRVPGQIGQLLANQLRRKKIPYAVEVVGDPWDVFAKGSINHPLRPFIRINGYLSLKKIIEGASASLYVTKNALQKRYKPRNGTPTFVASNVILEDAKINSEAKFFNGIERSIINIISVGSLAQMYKSPDIVLKAIRLLRNNGIQCSLTWLGDGIYRDDMVRFSETLGISDLVNFVGSVTSDEVREWLNKSDLFILVSRTEGLPRAVIEAMGAGLPCIGSRVGGIPELLDEEVLVQAGDEKELADKIKKMIENSQMMNQQAIRNLNEAIGYAESKLSNQRECFYNEIAEISK